MIAYKCVRIEVFLKIVGLFCPFTYKFSPCNLWSLARPSLSMFNKVIIAQLRFLTSSFEMTDSLLAGRPAVLLTTLPVVIPTTGGILIPVYRQIEITHPVFQYQK